MLGWQVFRANKGLCGKPPTNQHHVLCFSATHSFPS